MPDILPILYVARHGETALSAAGQLTGRQDVPLTPNGECNAKRLGARLRGIPFAKVFTSPLQRACRTCQLAGFADQAEIDRDLIEWDHGEYEGRTLPQIFAERPNWDVFRDGCPGGESAGQVGMRADRAIQRIRRVAGNVLLFSSAHFCRVLASRWLGLSAGMLGRYLLLNTASLSALSYDSDLSHPAIRLWNDDRHVVP